MGLYQRSPDGAHVESVRTLDGSAEDRRLAASDEWANVERETQSDVARPSEHDVKAEWVNYARQQGVPSYEIDAMTKADLIERTTSDGQE